MKTLNFLIIILLLLSSCKTTNLFEYENNSEMQKAIQKENSYFFLQEYQYKIRKDDKINISVWGQDELSVGSIYGIYNSNEVYGKWLMVDANGVIEVPKIGTLKVLNFTIPQLKDTLRNQFAKWVVKPIVDVKVLNKEITVMGEVRDPKVITVDKDKNTLLEMISRCGGLEFYANVKNIKVLRQDGQNVRVANLDLSKNGGIMTKNIPLLPGDVVIVPSKKNKEFDKRVSTIIPFTTTITAAAILLGTF